MAKKDTAMPVEKIPDFIEKRLLEEYRELGLCWRHDDEMFSKLTAVLLPLSIAALTLPYYSKVEIPKLLAATGGLMLMAFWFFSSESYKGRFEIRFTRIYQIEHILGLDSHLRYHRESTKSVWKDRPLRCCIFIAYLVIALLVTCDIKVESTDTWIINSVITAETIVFFIIVATVVGIWICTLIINRDRKHSNPENKA